MVRVKNNFLLQNVYNQVQYVNPFNQTFEPELHEQFEKRHNSPVELSKRHWAHDIPNKSFVYFGDCDSWWRVCERRQSPRNWTDLNEGEEPETLEKLGHLQVGLFFRPKSTFDNRFDVDENFDMARIIEYFENVYFTNPNIWNVFDTFGQVVSVLEHDMQFSTWKVLSNAGLQRKDRKAYQYDMPVTSYRQFQYDMHRCGVQLNWRSGVCLNNPDITWPQRNDPKLSHILDIIDNGAVFVGKRDGLAVLRLSEKHSIMIDHNQQTLAFSGLPSFKHHEELGRGMYMAIARLMLDAGREINHLRDKHQSTISVDEDKLFDEILFEIQRKLTI